MSVTPALWTIPTAPISQSMVAQLTARLEAITKIAGKKKFANSLSAEDMVILHHWRHEMKMTDGDFFLLDTGRLHPITLDYAKKIEQHYGITMARLTPDDKGVNGFINQYGLNGFYESVAARKACCGVRKVEPLKKYLADGKLWVTGQRREQSLTRGDIHAEEDDHVFGLKKFNPLFDWSEKNVFGYVTHHKIPLHPLYHKGFASIGCDPCSRAIKAGEDIRGGRWWWEEATQKECGINAINMEK